MFLTVHDMGANQVIRVICDTITGNLRKLLILHHAGVHDEVRRAAMHAGRHLQVPLLLPAKFDLSVSNAHYAIKEM